MRAQGFQIGPISVAFDGRPTLLLHARAVERIPPPDGPPRLACDTWQVHGPESAPSFVIKASIHEPAEVARLDLEGPTGTLWLRSDLDIDPLCYPLDQLIVIDGLASLGHERPGGAGLLVHAAAAADGAGAVLVAGPSGAGKTTFARAAAGLAGVRVLTDERAVLRPSPGGWLIDGTPWCGEGGFVSSETAPLRGLFLLEKSTRDEIADISPARAMAFLLRCCFPPLWRAGGLEMAMATLARVVSEVPCYLLRTRLGGHAAELVMQRPRRPRPVDAGSGRGGLVADLLRRGTPTELTVHGASMRPLIRGGDVLLVAPASTVAQGDVAVVARDGRLVAHRVVVASPLRMEGDALDGADLPTRDQELLGRVVAIRRGAREIRLRSPVGRLLSHHSRWLGKLRRALKWARRRRFDPNRLVRPLTSR